MTTNKITLTRKRDGSQIEITLNLSWGYKFEPHVRCDFQGVSCKIENTSQGPALNFNQYTMKTEHQTVGAAFGFKWDKKGGVNILIESAEPFDSIVAEWKMECEAAKTAREALENAQEKILVAWDFLDWGDYNITQERRIIELRAALPGEPEGWHRHRDVANLDSKKIGEMQEQWAAMVAAGTPIEMVGIRGDVVKIVQITPEQAEPFLAHLGLLAAEEAKRQAEQAARAAENRKREQ